MYWEFWENVQSLIQRVRSAYLKGKQDTNLIVQISHCRCNILESERDLLIINWQYHIQDEKLIVFEF